MPSEGKAGAAANGGEGDDGEGTVVSTEEHTKLKGELEDSKTRLTEAQRAMTDPDYLEWVADKRRREAAGDDGEDKGRRDGKGKSSGEALDLTKIDWEELSKKELAALIVRVLRADFQGIAQDIEGEFGKLGDEVENVKTAIDIDRVAAKYPDFWDMKDEILDIARKNPNITVLAAYKQVKGDQFVSGKIKPDAEDKRHRRGTEQERPGGITPRATKSSKKKSLDEALDDAFEAAGVSGERIE